LGSLRLAAAQGRRTDVTYAGWQLVQSVWECLALTNQVTFGRGLQRALAETDKLTSRPANLVELVNTISTSSDVDRILQAADELASATHRVLRDREPERPEKQSIQAQFDQVYPEMKDIVRKLLAACEAGDRIAASLEAYNLQSDVTSMLDDTQGGPARRRFTPYGACAAAHGQAGFPDLIALCSGPLDDLADAARRFDERLRNWLGDHGVGLCEFATIEELRGALL